MSRLRWVALALVLVAASALIVVEGLRRYASTRLVGGVARVYGGRVEADRATAGFWQSDLEGVRIYEADNEHVLLEVKRLTLGLTLWDLVTGRTIPEEMTLERPRLVLRLDRDGKLLTKPVAALSGGPLPTKIELQNASVGIEQEHRDRFEIGDATGTITGEGEELRLALELSNPRWGAWQASGQVDPSFQNGELSATGRAVLVTPELMKELPVLPANVSDQLTINGKVDTDIEFHFPAEGKPAFVAHFTTQHASAALPALGVEMKEVAADIDLKDSTLQLERLRATVAGGEIQAAGDLDLATEPLNLNLKLSAQHLDISKLPAAWSLPEETSGQLSGETLLKIGLTTQGPTQVTAEGHARIDKPVLAGVAVDPVDIRLKDVGFGEPGKPGVTSGTLSFDLKLQNAELSTLLARLQKFTNASPPEDLTGVVNTELHVAIPLATINDMATFRVTGDLKDSAVHWREFALDKLHSEIDYSGGRLKLQKVGGHVQEANLAAGEVSGAVSVDLAPLGDVAIKLAIDRIPLSSLAPIVKNETLPQGVASGQLDASAPLAAIADTSRWQGRGQLNIPELKYEGRNARDVSGAWELQDGVVRANDFRALVLDQQLAGKLSLTLQKPYAFTASFALPDAHLSDVMAKADVELAEPVAGHAAIQGGVEGSLQPLAWKGAGDATLTDLQVGKWNSEHTVFQWAIDPQQISLTKLKAEFLGGEIEAEATLPFAEKKPLKVAGDLRRIKANQLLEEIRGMSLDTDAVVSGHFTASGTGFADLSGEADLVSDQFEVRGITSHQAKVHVSIDRGVLEYDASGDLLDGQFAATGKLNLGKLNLGKEGVNDLNGSGHVALKHVPLQVAARLFNTQQRLPITGDADVTLDYELPDLQHSPTGRGRLVLSDVSWDRTDLARRLESELVISDHTLRLEDVSAQLGGGELRASATLPLDGHSPGEFRLGFSRVRSDRLLEFWPELQHDMDAVVDAQLHGTLGERVAGGGSISAIQAKVAGIDVNGVRLPVQFLYSPTSGRGEVKIQESTVQAAHGRIRGKATIVYDRTFAISGKVQLTDLRLSSLSPARGSLGGLSTGRISGTAEFSSNNFRSLDDVAADFNLSFDQARASQFPVLGSISKYVMPTVPSATSFQKGKLVGRLHGGVVDIKQFLLTGNDTRIMADGTVALSGRIDLNVIALTGGDPLSRGIVRRAVLPVIEAEVVPLALLTRANAVMADQIVYLRVGGTVQSPNVQVRAAPQLAYEALRFFVTGTTAGL